MNKAHNPGLSAHRRSAPWVYAAGCAAAVTLFAAPAWAYGDPGSGALLWQLIIAGMFGFLFYIRRFFSKVRQWLGRKEPAPPRREE